MSGRVVWREEKARLLAAGVKCPNAGTWLHADLAESLNMPVGTLLSDAQGQYCPACDFQPAPCTVGPWGVSPDPLWTAPDSAPAGRASKPKRQPFPAWIRRRA